MNTNLELKSSLTREIDIAVKILRSKKCEFRFSLNFPCDTFVQYNLLKAFACEYKTIVQFWNVPQDLKNNQSYQVQVSSNFACGRCKKTLYRVNWFLFVDTVQHQILMLDDENIRRWKLIDKPNFD